jgi:hypothetical protein
MIGKADRFDEMLNEVYPEYSMGWVSFTPAQILKECDPIAYRIALSEFEDFFQEEEKEEDGDDVYLAS